MDNSSFWYGVGGGFASTKIKNMTVCGCCPKKGSSLVSSCHMGMARLYMSHAGEHSGEWECSPRIPGARKPDMHSKMCSTSPWPLSIMSMCRTPSVWARVEATCRLNEDKTMISYYMYKLSLTCEPHQHVLLPKG